MNRCEGLKQEYLQELDVILKELKEKADSHATEKANDEAILETIKTNIVEIFYKMFNISYNNSCRGVEPEEIELNKLAKAYLAFFDKIPTPWKVKMEKDREHNMMEEYHKEEIKLETAEMIRSLFLSYHERYLKEV